MPKQAFKKDLKSSKLKSKKSPAGAPQKTAQPTAKTLAKPVGKIPSKAVAGKAAQVAKQPKQPKQPMMAMAPQKSKKPSKISSLKNLLLGKKKTGSHSKEAAKEAAKQVGNKASKGNVKTSVKASAKAHAKGHEKHHEKHHDKPATKHADKHPEKAHDKHHDKGKSAVKHVAPAAPVSVKGKGKPEAPAAKPIAAAPILTKPIAVAKVKKAKGPSRGDFENCREVACEGLSTTGGYCRMHYIKNWKKIKRKEVILKEGKLNQYIEELVVKYPDKYIEAIRQDLANDKDFAKVIYDLDLDESVDDFSEDGDSADSIIDNIKREFEDEGDF